MKRRKYRGKSRDPQGLVHTSVSKVLKHTLIAKRIWFAGTPTQTFAPGGKHPRAAWRMALLFMPRLQHWRPMPQTQGQEPNPDSPKAKKLGLKAKAKN